MDNLTVESYNSTTSSYVTELVETFDTDGSGYAEETPVYDANGNLTYDGTQQYTYDAWNRLTSIAHAYRDGSGVHAGQVTSTMSYDGMGRRTVKAINLTGEWDCTYNYYYDHQRCIEERDGSNIPFKQQVWGTQYVDELVQQRVGGRASDNDDGGEEMEDTFFVLQDANYNVLGTVFGGSSENNPPWSVGQVAERFEYTPYGERNVFFSAGANDAGAYDDTLTSERVYEYTEFVNQPWGLCEFGHQGLMHDEESGLVYNRARVLSPTLGTFSQRDPLVAGTVKRSGKGCYLGTYYYNILTKYGRNLNIYEGAKAVSRRDPSGRISFPTEPPPSIGPLYKWSGGAACGWSVFEVGDPEPIAWNFTSLLLSCTNCDPCRSMLPDPNEGNSQALNDCCNEAVDSPTQTYFQSCYPRDVKANLACEECEIVSIVHHVFPPLDGGMQISIR